MSCLMASYVNLNLPKNDGSHQNGNTLVHIHCIIHMGVNQVMHYILELFMQRNRMLLSLKNESVFCFTRFRS